MKAHTASLINAVLLIVLPLWGYFSSETPSNTALIPVSIGVVLLAMNYGVKKENKIIAHIAVLLTLLILFGLIKPFMGSLEEKLVFVHKVKDKNTFISKGLKDKYNTDSTYINLNNVKNDSICDSSAFKILIKDFVDAKFELEEGKLICEQIVKQNSKLWYENYAAGRIIVMILSTIMAMIFFVKSFIDAKKRRVQAASEAENT